MIKAGDILTTVQGDTGYEVLAVYTDYTVLPAKTTLDVKSPFGGHTLYGVPADTFVVPRHTIPILSPSGSSNLQASSGYQGPSLKAVADTLKELYGTSLRESLRLSARTQCAHKWQHYQGIMEVYDFCTICDEKRK